MPAGNFDEKLNVTANGTVNAGGPLDASVTEVTELCVWVLQRNGANDAIANAMGMPDMAGMPSDLKVHDLGTPECGLEIPADEPVQAGRLPCRLGDRIGIRRLRGRQGPAEGVLLVRAGQARRARRTEALRRVARRFRRCHR